jgi:hypothetical protein
MKHDNHVFLVAVKRFQSALTAECFTFIKEPIVHEPYETVRLAGVTRGRQPTSALDTSPFASPPASVACAAHQSDTKNCGETSEVQTSAISSGLHGGDEKPPHDIRLSGHTMDGTASVKADSTPTVCDVSVEPCNINMFGNDEMLPAASVTVTRATDVDFTSTSVCVQSSEPDNNVGKSSAVATREAPIQVKHIARKVSKERARYVISIGAKRRRIKRSGVDSDSVDTTCAPYSVLSHSGDSQINTDGLCSSAISPDTSIQGSCITNSTLPSQSYAKVDAVCSSPSTMDCSLSDELRGEHIEFATAGVAVSRSTASANNVPLNASLGCSTSSKSVVDCVSPALRSAIADGKNDKIVDAMSSCGSDGSSSHLASKLHSTRYSRFERYMKMIDTAYVHC